MAKKTHTTKDGRTAKKGLYYNMNKAREEGRSKPGKGTVTDKALARSAKTAKPTRKKLGSGGPANSFIAKGCGKVMSSKRKRTTIS